MEPISFWPFVWRWIARAATESADFFEWKLKTAITAIVLVVLGFLLFWRVRGLAETREEASKYFVLVAAPTVLFLAGLFLYNAFRAPYLTYIEEYGKAQAKIEEANSGKAKAELRVAELERQLAERPKPQTAEKAPRPHVIDRNGPVNGRAFYQDEAGNLNFPDPLSIKNSGDLTTQQISVHVYFSEVVALTVRPFWDSTGTGDPRFPFELWVSGPIQINPGETWKIPTLQGKRANIQWEKPIVVKIEVFYGAPKPEQAIFRIEKSKSHP